MTSTSHTAVPTPAAIRLGAQLKRLRGRRTVAASVKSVGKTASWLSHVEAGRTRIQPSDLERLLETYGLPLTSSEARLALWRCRRLAEPSWWDALAGVIDPRNLAYLAHEAEASEIRSYEVVLIPGLLQTEAYARAILATRVPQVAPDVVARRLQARMHRQDLILRESSPAYLHAIISEAALRFAVGGAAVHHEQLRHLLTIAQRPNIKVQIVPFSAGEVPAARDAFTLLSFDDGAVMAAVEQQQITTNLTQDPGEVAEMTAAYDMLVLYSLNQWKSIQWMKEQLC